MMQKSQQSYQIILLQILAWHFTASGEQSGTAAVILGGWESLTAETQLGKTAGIEHRKHGLRNGPEAKRTNNSRNHS